MQVKLLRVLQEREFYRVGGTSSVKVDVRIIAATNQDLERMVKKGDFRADLYFRLNIISLEIPPLRERKDDIPELIQHFLQILTDRHNKSSPTLTPESLQVFIEYDWPGNIRELANIIERLVVLGSEGRIDYNELINFFPFKSPSEEIVNHLDTSYTSEKKMLKKVLKDTYGNKSAAA